MSAENTLQAPLRTATVSRTAVDAVEHQVSELCRRHAEKLPFHGWHHISFVRAKAVEFAQVNGSDVAVVEAAALVHDVNYIVHRNSTAAAGRRLRLEILAKAGVGQPIGAWIDRIVREAEMASRHREISLEAQALSDGDTLFKALPVTPVVLAHRYLAETGVSLRELANKIVSEQQNVHDDGYYFYNPEAAATYTRWAATNLQLWQCIKESLDDPTVEQLLHAVS
jgi:uncharacterized protein